MRTAVGVAALGGVIIAMAWRGKREWGAERARRARQEIHAWLIVTGSLVDLERTATDIAEGMRDLARAVAQTQLILDRFTLQWITES